MKGLTIQLFGTVVAAHTKDVPIIRGIDTQLDNVIAGTGTKQQLRIENIHESQLIISNISRLSYHQVSQLQSILCLQLWVVEKVPLGLGDQKARQHLSLHQRTNIVNQVCTEFEQNYVEPTEMAHTLTWTWIHTHSICNIHMTHTIAHHTITWYSTSIATITSTNSSNKCTPS